MLDGFEILTTSGVVLWSKHYVPVGVNVINSLIKDVLIEDNVQPGSIVGGDGSASRNPQYKKDKYTLKWTLAKDLGLIFVAVYQSLLQLSWIDKLLDNVKALFTALYRDQFKKPGTTVVDCPFDEYFDRQIAELEKSGAGAVTASLTGSSSVSELTPPPSNTEDERFEEAAPPLPGLRKATSRFAETDTTSTEAPPIATPDSSRPASPAIGSTAASSSVLTSKPTGPAGRASRRARKAVTSSTPSSRDGSAGGKAGLGTTRPTAKKSARKWNADGMVSDDEGTVLDYSAASTTGNERDSSAGPPDAIAADTWSKTTAEGEFVLKDLDDEMSAILASSHSAATASSAAPAGVVGTSMGALSSLFRNVVGGKTLTSADLSAPLRAMEAHLIGKNVAREAAVRLCEAVASTLTGTRTASFTSVDASIRGAMEGALAHMLTPASTLDLLRAIQANSARQAALPPPSSSSSPRRPYVVSVVGVNGVGKSTTLAKLAFLLLHNDLRVLVAAADTFRSGAVEQLRAHVRNLRELTARTPGRGHIALFERGYGRDAAVIARDAVAFAAAPTLVPGQQQDGSGDDELAPYDVVLVDTAGRRHNDARLMSSLEKFAQLARPDRILMVGEALVGGDAVAQARHFDAAFGPGRRLDGFVVSKCDTVGDMVGTIVSMVHATGVPVVALGVGQHYGDLRSLNVAWAARLLMA